MLNRSDSLCIVVGEGLSLTYERVIVERKGLDDKLSFAGELCQEEVGALLAQADVSLLSSNAPIVSKKWGAPP